MSLLNVRISGETKVIVTVINSLCVGVVTPACVRLMKLLHVGSSDSEVKGGGSAALCLHHTLFVLFKEEEVCRTSRRR